MSNQVEEGIVAFGVTLGVASQAVYCSQLVTGLTNERARTWLPIRGSPCLIGLPNC